MILVHYFLSEVITLHILIISTQDSLLLCLTFVEVYSVRTTVEIRFFVRFVLKQLAVLVVRILKTANSLIVVIVARSSDAVGATDA